MNLIFKILNFMLIWLAVPLVMGAYLRAWWWMFMFGWGWL